MSRIFISSAIVILVVSVAATAGVTDFDISASSTVTQYRSGSQEQQQTLSRQYPDSSSAVPVEVITELRDESAASNPFWASYNRALVNDPQYNQQLPTDFILENAAGSADEDVSIDMTSQATQTRTITIAQSEFPTFNSSQTIDLQSVFLLDGAMVGVVPVTADSAEGLSMTLNLDIKKGSESLWSGWVEAVGQADGSIETTVEGFRANDFSVLPIDLEDVATIYAIDFDDSVIQYQYSSAIDETFDLSATLALEFEVPGGLGAGSAFGTVPAELIVLTQDLFGEGSLEPPAAAAPEPATLVLLLAGAGLVRCGLRRRMVS